MKIKLTGPQLNALFEEEGARDYDFWEQQRDLICSESCGERWRIVFKHGELMKYFAIEVVYNDDAYDSEALWDEEAELNEAVEVFPHKVLTTVWKETP